MNAKNLNANAKSYFNSFNLYRGEQNKKMFQNKETVNYGQNVPYPNDNIGFACVAFINNLTSLSSKVNCFCQYTAGGGGGGLLTNGDCYWA
jgi:hypothetical protein